MAPVSVTVSISGGTVSSTALIILVLTALAALSDLRTGKIRNVIPAAGALAGLILWTGAGIRGGLPGLLSAAGLFFSGAALPFLLMFPLFRFRMIGAGDVKLLMAVGALTGPSGILKYMAVSIALGAGIAALIMIFVTGIRPRLRHLACYARDALITGKPGIYRDVPEAEFHFAVPVFMAAVLHAGGFF